MSESKYIVLHKGALCKKDGKGVVLMTAEEAIKTTSIFKDLSVEDYTFYKVEEVRPVQSGWTLP